MSLDFSKSIYHSNIPPLLKPPISHRPPNLLGLGRDNSVKIIFEFFIFSIFSLKTVVFVLRFFPTPIYCLFWLPQPKTPRFPTGPQACWCWGGVGWGKGEGTSYAFLPVINKECINRCILMLRIRIQHSTPFHPQIKKN
ncbi:hypothetical protein E2C01_074324 [Portunus trituberculatus]|uniref:Uncharacterized protein n=1 Tax=Portunus trituberculatus TaxID=210409 RepID=A0A5B7IG11_PORTR|nr:hypothetical protein [Portunus trituberculatus]